MLSSFVARPSVLPSSATSGADVPGPDPPQADKYRADNDSDNDNNITVRIFRGMTSLHALERDIL
jgi:hypothetical protein